MTTIGKSLPTTAETTTTTRPAAKRISKPLAKAVKKTVISTPKKATPQAKASAPAKPKTVVKAVAKTPTKVAASKPSKVKKPKMVRDSLTIPKLEYAVLDVLKLRAAKLAQPAKKTELIRAGIKAIAALSDTAFLAALRAVPSLKTGRPAKAKSAKAPKTA